jgi:hypothetical protein
MSDLTRTCPNCGSHTSSVGAAFAEGEPCPYCGAEANLDQVHIFTSAELRVHDDRIRAEALAPVLALADELAAERDRIRQAYRDHNAGRTEGRPIVRPDLDTWASAYEVAERKTRAALRAAAGTPTHRNQKEET